MEDSVEIKDGKKARITKRSRLAKRNEHEEFQNYEDIRGKRFLSRILVVIFDGEFYQEPFLSCKVRIC